MLMDKYRGVLESQRLHDRMHSSPETQSEPEKIEEQSLTTLRDIIEGIREEYFSDLTTNDIGDDEVSDVDESEINLGSATLAEQNPTLSS